MKIEYSQLSPEYLKNFLAVRYEMPSITEVVYLHQGINDTYLVLTTSQKYILRIYRYNWKSYQDILGELELIQILSRNKINVSFPIPDGERKLVQKLIYPEGVRYCVLFSHASGNALPSLDMENAELFGKQLAQIHSITKQNEMRRLSKSYEPSSILSFTKSSLSTRLGKQHSLFNQLYQIEQILEQKLTLDVLKQLHRGVCHGDPHYENCFKYAEKNELVFFDFDFCGNGYLLYDLGSFFHYERNKPEIKKSFLTAYTSVIPLTDIASSLIPYFEVLMRLFHLGARALNADGIKNPIWTASQIERTTSEIHNQLSKLVK